LTQKACPYKQKNNYCNKQARTVGMDDNILHLLHFIKITPHVISFSTESTCASQLLVMFSIEACGQFKGLFSSEEKPHI